MRLKIENLPWNHAEIEDKTYLDSKEGTPGHTCLNEHYCQEIKWRYMKCDSPTGFGTKLFKVIGFCLTQPCRKCRYDGGCFEISNCP